MRKMYKTLLAMVCAAAILAGINATPVLATGAGTELRDESEPVVIACTEVPLYIDEKYIGSGIMVDAVTFVPLLTFTEHILQETCQVEWDQETETATIATEELNLSLTMDQGYMTANGRYVYFEDGVYNINGTIIVPIRALAKIFCLDLDWDEEAWAVHIDDSESRVFDSGDEFYDEGELFWLSRVIFSEAGNQPMEGMIGVGNVVLNRVNDKEIGFADTVFGVIFQEGQFAVVSSGMIYMIPSDEAIVAAKLCLEGYNTVGDSKWFENPRGGLYTWMQLNRTLTATIGDHNFYT